MLPWDFTLFYSQIMVKEEDRLATTIEAIDYDVRIVPRGAYFRTALGTVEVNRSFEGVYK